MNVQGWFPLGLIGLTWSFYLCLKLKIEIVCPLRNIFLLVSANFTSCVKFLQDLYWLFFLNSCYKAKEQIKKIIITDYYRKQSCKGYLEDTGC